MSYVIAFLEGIITFISPCLLPMLPIYITYFAGGGLAVQFNIVDPETLRKAQKEPEKYRDLQVRICGWNVYWNSISKREQDAYIRQADKL